MLYRSFVLVVIPIVVLLSSGFSAYASHNTIAAAEENTQHLPAPVPLTVGYPQLALMSPEAQQERIDALEKGLAEVIDQLNKKTDAGIPLHGFADVTLGKSSRDYGALSPKGFSSSGVDLYLSPQFSDQTHALIEALVEPDANGEVGVDLERLQLGYAFSDALTLWSGRFHTPYGYWNTGFHHGAQIQTALTRPKFLDFEDKGGILPAHSVGLWATGNIRYGTDKINYDVYVANGSRITAGALDMNNAKDDNANKALGINLGYEFRDDLEGLRLGIHGLREEVDAYVSGVSVARVMLTMLGGYAVYDNNDWEIISEYYHFNNADLLTTRDHSSWAGFAQLGITVQRRWTPYARYEKASFNPTDPYFSYQTYGQSYQRSVVGLRFDLNIKTSLKLEVDTTRQHQTTAPSLNYNEIRVQYAVAF
ncbi:MAG: hypothetical protein HY080_12215 [Gammaproteobacteria bacterium]|nr:hypothetical protein [Gammaproteobacteria bacterium]